MRIKPLKSISRIAVVLIVLSIIPSCAFALENGTQTNSTNHAYDLKFGHAFGLLGKISEENFADVQAGLLESISKKITDLQSLYTNVSKASNASDLQEVLSSHRPANECMDMME